MNALHIMKFIRTKEHLIKTYAMWGCKDVFLRRFCRDID